MTQRTGLGAPAQERPKLLSDQPRGARVMLVAALLAGTFVLGHVVRYDYAAIYYNLLELWHPVTAGYHHLIPDPTWRHEGRYAVEGLYSGASVQIVFYNFARRWPPGPPGWFARRVCRPLLIPHERLPGQALWCLALSWWWMIAFAAPVFVLGIWLLTVSGLNAGQIGHTLTLPAWLHADQSLLTTWQQPVLGFVCSFIGARTVVKGTAFHAQRLIIKERLEAGHTRPAWWMPLFPFLRWRFDWDRAHWHGELEHNQHTALHRAILALAIAAFAFLAYEGWHILTYFNAPWE